MIYMSHNNLSDNALGLLADALKENCTLTELFITHNDLSLPNGLSLIQSLSNKTLLKSLALNNCSLKIEQIEALAEAMKEN